MRDVVYRETHTHCNVIRGLGHRGDGSVERTAWSRLAARCAVHTVQNTDDCTFALEGEREIELQRPGDAPAETMNQK